MEDGDALEHDIDRWEGEGGALPGTSALGTPVAVRSRVRRVLGLSRKVGVAIAGGGVVLVGVALIVLSGPAIVVIPVGSPIAPG
jgi:hypothetical protein